MKIAVINGSPKGNNSITLQTVLYIQKKFPNHEYSYINAAQGIFVYENVFSKAAEQMKNADLIIFSYPVYTFMVPSQLHRFIELIKKNGISLEGRYATQVTTSKHFYDVTAHRYIQENCADMGLRYIRGLSADMDDLPKKSGQKDAVMFFKRVEWEMENGAEDSWYMSSTPYVRNPVNPDINDTPKIPGKKIAIVTDCRKDDIQLGNMINRFRKVFAYETSVINIREENIKGGCLGCLNCTSSGKCVYKDDFQQMLEERIHSCDGVIYAFTIDGHSMGSCFKKFDDRQFCNGHRTVTMGSPVGYIISGNYTDENNLRMILEARAETGGNYFVGVAGDEQNTDISVDILAKKYKWAVENSYVQPRNFYGIGGMRIFRDLIYLMQGMMKADHKFFKEHGQYDFPQKKKGTIIAMYMAGAMFSNDRIRAKLGGKINEGMLAPYKKVLDGK